MICPSCSQENEADAQFCHACGAGLLEEPESAPEPSELLPGVSALVSNMGDTAAALARAMALGALAFVIVVLLAEVVAFAAFFDGDTSVGDAVKVGGILFYAFHHAGIQMGFPTFDPAALPGGEAVGDLGIGAIEMSFTGAAALLLGTSLAVFLLFRAGRRAAEAGGGTVLAHVLHGALVAVPYALLALLLSFAISFDIGVPAEQAEAFSLGGSLSIGISSISALFWPLVIAVIAGAAGGLAAARSALARDPRGPMVLSILGGAARMLAIALIAGFIGLLVLAGANPDATASYFGAVTEGREGLALLLFTVLAAPNLAAAGLVVGMGGSLVLGDSLGTSSITLISLTDFPRGLGLTNFSAGAIGNLTGSPLPFEMGSPGAEYFVFLLAPLTAVVMGGRWAARRAEAASYGQAAAIGSGAGVLFALGVALVALLAGIGMESRFVFGGISQSQMARVGPALLNSGLLALAWGVVGGAAGGALGGAAGPAPGPAGRGLRLPGPRESRVGVAPPGGAGTGFEGLAAEQAGVGGDGGIHPEPIPAAVPEPVPTEESAPLEEPVGADGVPASVAPPDPAETVRGSPEEGSPVFEFATPATQYREPSAQPALEPDFPEPGFPEPEVPEPDFPEPGFPEPEVPEPDFPEPGFPEPEVPEPEVPEPEVPEPEVPEPELIPEPELPEPDFPEPLVSEPEVPEPEFPGPETPDPGTPTPGIELPETGEPELPEPAFPEPEFPELETPDPGTPAPGIEMPETGEPELPEPAFPEPEAPEPGDEPGLWGPDREAEPAGDDDKDEGEEPPGPGLSH